MDLASGALHFGKLGSSFRKIRKNIEPTMPASNLARQLQALQIYVGGTQEDLFKLLLKYAASGEAFAPSTFSDVLNGKRQGTRKAGHIGKALEKYAVAKELHLENIVREYAATSRDVGQARFRAVPQELTGAWFLVQYRGKRFARSDVVAKDDHRIAVLIYGGDHETGRRFQIVGKSTVWSGHVSMHPQDDLLYYSAHETDRLGIVEWVRMLVHAPFIGAGDTGDHHGIILGIGRGSHDAPDFPIYASRVLLSRIENEKEKGLTAPLADAEVKVLRKYCDYVPRAGGISNGTSIRGQTDPLLVERDRAIQCFEDRGSATAQAQGNYGDRIFARF
jgi:hypothetical protein